MEGGKGCTPRPVPLLPLGARRVLLPYTSVCAPPHPPPIPYRPPYRVYVNVRIVSSTALQPHYAHQGVLVREAMVDD